MANILRSKLHDVISNTHTGSMSGRNITEEIHLCLRGYHASQYATVRPFFTSLTALKKKLDDELRKKDTEIPLSVHWVYLYEFGMHI
jgi:hypothetical protein